MSTYLVKTKLGATKWQLLNQARSHHFICDDQQHDAGPNPVEYLCASVNSCISMSAGMVAASQHLPLRAFTLSNEATTKDLGSGRSIVTQMKIKISFAGIEDQQCQQFIKHVLRVSTVYQTLKPALNIQIALV